MATICCGTEAKSVSALGIGQFGGMPGPFERYLRAMRGHAITGMEQAGKASGLKVNETHTRGFSIRELRLARHAQAVLEEDKSKVR